MNTRQFSIGCGLVVASLAVTVGFAADATASSRDKAFFETVSGNWKGPGEIVAGKYKGTKFTCNLFGEPASGKSAGIKLDGTCRVGVFSQPMSAVISQVGNSYKGKFLDGADGKGLDIVSGTVNGDKVVVGINRQKLNGAMIARIDGDNAMNVTISVKVEDRMVPVIGLTLNRDLDAIAVGSIKQ
ncbi:hypothetical protein MRS76_18255 [Rhizobiaceae bacterium n13]|uniref:Uncharacterized protein n=1 Tax=Ferirhizobium litorale TaxID=2927786 RepID=A0AAE3U5P4_9HYPH|nr:hypothetical protein [Fererhizobium litorale]MDI7863899.1 hypothetical protein [Fererhizobium litorale]MDI7924269.1 hypothetical protein [Fererhizobium litorale]